MGWWLMGLLGAIADEEFFVGQGSQRAVDANVLVTHHFGEGVCIEVTHAHRKFGEGIDAVAILVAVWVALENLTFDDPGRSSGGGARSP